ncbi:MAG: ABC transporter substrate-binding protein [Bacillota bacterium]
MMGRFKAATRNRRLIWSLAVIMGLILVAGSGCGDPERADPPSVDDPDTADPGGEEDDRYGGTAVLRIQGEIATLNPFFGGDTIIGQVGAFTAERLVMLNEDSEYEGQLATHWSVSENGLEYTFHLRDDVTWHDGEHFTADDVIFSFELLMNEEAAVPARSNFLIGGEPIEMEKVDDYTVKMIVPELFAPVLTTVARLPMAPKHIVEHVNPADLDTCDWGEEPIHTGPFKFAEYRAGEYVRLVRHDDYWGGMPYLEEVVLRIIPDMSPTTVALESDQVYFSDVPPDVFQRLDQEGKLQTFSAPSGNVQFFCMNNLVWPFDDVRVRKAINHVINREAICEHAFLGYAQPAENFMVPTDMYYNEDAIVRYEFEVDRAQELLEEAGFEPGSDGIMTKDGRRLEFELIITQGNAQREQAALIIQSDFEKAGISVVPRTMEWSAQVGILTAGMDPPEYETMIMGNTLGPDPDRYHAVYGPSQYLTGFNYLAYLNDEVEDLFQLGRITVDEAERQAVYEELQHVITDDAPVGWLWYAETLYAFSPELRVEEAGLTGQGHIRFLKPAGLYIQK